MKGIYLSLCSQKKTVIVTKVSHLQARTSFQLTVQITKESTFLAPSFCPSDFVYKEKWFFSEESWCFLSSPLPTPTLYLGLR